MAVLVLVAAAAEELAVGVRTEMGLTRAEKPKLLTQIHRPRRRAVRPHSERLGIPVA